MDDVGRDAGESTLPFSVNSREPHRPPKTPKLTEVSAEPTFVGEGEEREKAGRWVGWGGRDPFGLCNVAD